MRTAARTVELQMETRRSRLRRSARTEGEAGSGEGLCLLDMGVLKTAVMIGLSLLHLAQQNQTVSCRQKYPNHVEQC